MESSIGNNIQFQRVKSNMTQNELANKLDVAASTVSAWEIGRNEPDVKTLNNIADVLGCKLNDIIGSNNTAPPELSEDEFELVKLYRNMSMLNKMELYAFAKGLK